jgi:hypothetical protein
MAPTDVVPGIGSELAKECSLRAPITLAKWVQGIDFTEVVGEAIDEAVLLEAAESILMRELIEYRSAGVWNVSG